MIALSSLLPYKLPWVSSSTESTIESKWSEVKIERISLIDSWKPLYSAVILSRAGTPNSANKILWPNSWATTSLFSQLGRLRSNSSIGLPCSSSLSP